MAKLNYDNKKALESQKLIYKGLRRILLRKPLSEVTITDIAVECQISRSTFYRNFRNVIDVLDVIFDYFYERYLLQREEKENTLLFFFEYWQKHRDLINILSNQNEWIVKKAIQKYETKNFANPYFINLKYAIWTSIIVRWSESKVETPEEMYLMTKSFLDKKCLDILLD